jgi:hypothetical protein
MKYSQAETPTTAKSWATKRNPMPRKKRLLGRDWIEGAVAIRES